MRLKFFITIFFVLSVTAASVSSIHYHFFRGERLRLMELNLQQNATLLTDSDLSLSRKEFSNQGEEFVRNAIGDDKVNMIVAIYNDKGKLLYKNENAHIFDLPATLSLPFQTWEDVEKKDYFIKYLTQHDPKQNRIIKVGMILNQSLIRWKDLNQRIVIYVGLLLFFIAIISFFLTAVLFKPVQNLAEQVNLMSEKIDSGEFADLQSWFQKLKLKSRRNDEFSSLLSSLDKLANKIRDTQSLTQRWSALMAHELKTPMTLLRMSIDNMLTKSEVSSESVTAVENELNKLETIIMDFLEWASVENDSSKPEIHAINVPYKVQENVTSLQKNLKDMTVNVYNTCNDDFRIFCNPIHLDQMLNNLITNAGKYGGNTLDIYCETGKIIFQDQGQGIPDKVLQNFGKPFNKFKQNAATDGHGLGLAWVNTIANKYQWKVQVSNAQGTRIEITFPASHL